MGFGKFLGKVAGEISKTLKEANKERDRIKTQQEEEHHIAEQELQAKMQLLDKFDFHLLKSFCTDVLGRLPPDQYYKDEKSGEQKKLELDRHDYVEFIVDGNQRIKLSHIKEYAIKKKIVTPYFGEQSNADEEKREFENIVNSIRLHFQPEKITHEEHLEAQLTIFLKAKFPERKVERQIFSKSGDRLDILIDNKYVFELKVPKNKTDLRNLSAQIDEYIENYPNICVVIADTSQIPAEKEEEKVEAGLSENIRDYVEKYKLKYRVQTVVFNIELRK